MSDFTAIVNDVYSMTNREDLVNETILAVKAATLKMHGTDKYFKDLFEVPITFNPTAYLQSFDPKTVAPKFRSFKYLRKYDALNDIPGDFFDIILPEQVLDAYGYQRYNVAYGAGSVIQIRSNTLDEHMLFGCYLYPTIDSESTYTSWIADECPYAIAYEAAAIIYGTNLRDKSAADSARAQSLDFFNVIKNDNLDLKGY